MPGSRRAVGAEAEDRAAQFLLSLGYTLVTRRFCARGGEIDLIAVDGDMLVFVEVKARRTARPEEALTQRKGSRLRSAIHAYLQGIGEPERAFRIDLIAVEDAELRHHVGVELLEHIARPEADDDVWSAETPSG